MGNARRLGGECGHRLTAAIGVVRVPGDISSELVAEAVVALTRGDLAQRHFDETGDIAESVRHPGVFLSIANLVELMLTQSNNNATDRVLELIGGPAAVTAWLRSIGIYEMRVDNSVNALLCKFYGLPVGSSAMKGYLEKFSSEVERDRVNGTPQAEFESALDDTTTPRAMLALLEVLFDGHLLSIESREFLMGVMTRCETGPGRIKGQLPPGTVVAHKTGTIGGTVNDAGLIVLPENRGRVILSIYTKGSQIPRYEDREPLLAELARTVYDLFAFA